MSIAELLNDVSGNRLNPPDWLELLALTDSDARASMQDLVSEIRRSGIAEVIDSGQAFDEDDPESLIVDRGSERSQALAESAIAEIEERERHCGGQYPFCTTGDSLEALSSAGHIYKFLLVLSVSVGSPACGIDPRRLFEEVAAQAALSSFGGPDAGAEVFRFGWPRKDEPARFREALERWLEVFGLGHVPRTDTDDSHVKDDGLDVIVWRNFPDRRTGKVVAFGQCATGENWISKTTELQPAAFCHLWLSPALVPEPLRLLFVPYRVAGEKWDYYSAYGGILFDRCRIAYECRDAPYELVDRCRRWTRFQLRDSV